MPLLATITIDIDPTIVRVGVVQLTWHGFFTAVGTLAGIWLAVRWAKRAGYTEDATVSTAMWSVVGAIIGARLFHVVDQWGYYSQHLIQIVLLNEGGIAIYGAIVGGVTGGAIYAYRHALRVARLTDVACIPLILGMAIGRIGDVINGEHHGAHAEGFPLAVVYTHPDTLGEIGIPVHLAVGYELALDLVILVVLIWLARGIRRSSAGGVDWSWQPRYPRDGMLFWTYLFLYSSGRFVIEFYRQDTIFALGISQSQLLAAIGTIAAVWMLVYLGSRRASAPIKLPSTLT